MSSLLPLVVLAGVLGADVWVYADAKEHQERGAPVVASIGAFRLSTPTAWFLGCVVLWIVFFPLYLTSRGRAGCTPETSRGARGPR
jgi:hypothetical protein